MIFKTMSKLSTLQHVVYVIVQVCIFPMAVVLYFSSHLQRSCNRDQTHTLEYIAIGFIQHWILNNNKLHFINPEEYEII